jgi:hypothetical protein
MMREGSKVSYTGMDADGVSLGDQGRVLLTDGSRAEVLWHTGARINQVTVAAEFDLVVTGSRASDGLEDSLEVGGLVTFSARHAYDEGGEVAILNQMADAGHLAAFADIAEEALSMVASRLRQDASFRAVTAQLEEEEAEGVLRLASACLIRDAFSEEI